MDLGGDKHSGNHWEDIDVLDKLNILSLRRILMITKLHLIARCAIVGGYALELTCCADLPEGVAKLLIVTGSIVLLAIWLAGDKDATE